MIDEQNEMYDRVDALIAKHKDKEIHERIQSLIEETREDGSFTGGVTLEEIEACEQLLSVKFPDDYKWFLSNYGCGQICGRRILGISTKSYNSVVKNTLDCWERGMPNYFICIVDNEEYYFCINTQDGKIMNWCRYETAIYVKNNTFIDFLLDEIESAINLHGELSCI
jgi:antitoxin YobK